MTLIDYVLNGPSTVIFDDDRDPFVSWQHHLERAGRGGVDLVAVVGTPVLAPTDGWMDHRPADGNAGDSCRFRHAKNEGWQDVFSHFSAYTRPDGAFFRKGEVIALSGDTGGVVQHLHRHLLDPAGTRRNPWDYFSSHGFASLPTTPIDNLTTSRKQDQTMFVITSPSYRAAGKQVLITESAGAFEQPDVIAVTTRQLCSSVDLEHDHDLIAQVEQAWYRANLDRDLDTAAVREAIVKWSSLDDNTVRSAFAAADGN